MLVLLVRTQIHHLRPFRQNTLFWQRLPGFRIAAVKSSHETMRGSRREISGIINLLFRFRK